MNARYYGTVPISHSPADVGVVQRMVKKFQPAYTVELGTMQGGLTLAIHDACKTSPIVTFDNRREYCYALVKLIADGFVEFFCRDVLSRECREAVRYCWNGEHKKFLYCDNGNKVKEVLMYGKYLHSGDMLGVHDWGVEIHTDPLKVEPRWRAINEDINFFHLKQMLEKFELVAEGEQTRIWIKR